MDDKEPQNCYEFHNCPEETRNECPAYMYEVGRGCWRIASDFIEEGCPKLRYGGGKERGIMFCMKKCEWFKKLNPNIDKKP